MYPESLKNLIEGFRILPGIGEKTAERMAFFILNTDIENAEFFSEAIMSAKKKLKRCKKCNNLTENDICMICENNTRNKDKLCIIEDVKTLYLMEKNGVFNGYYYILKDLISPLNGVNPEDIGLEGLITNINNSNYKEVIIAVKSSIEGETTSLYIKKILEGLELKITRIASGIPMGADMEYIDSLTLERAMKDRKEIN